MASLLKVDALTGVTTAGSISVTGEGNSTTTNLQQGLAKAWVNFNGTGTVAIRTSLNHSSITDNGTGNYTTNLTNAFSAADFCVADSANRWAGCGIVRCSSSSQVSLYTMDGNSGVGALVDSDTVGVSNHGDLA